MENSTTACSAIQHVYQLKQELASKLQNGDIRSESDQAWILVIKLQAASAINTILSVCDNEYTTTKNISIKNMKNCLAATAVIKDFRDVSPALLETLTPTLDRLEKYFKRHTPDATRMSTNVELFNIQLAEFKRLVHLPEVVFTPDTIRQYLKKTLYAWVDQQETAVVLDFLSNLLQQDTFDPHLPSNAARLRAIRFLIQLKKIFEKKQERFECSEKIKNSEHRQKKEKKIVPIVVCEEYSKFKTFDEYLDDADKDFSTGGIALLQRAQKKYDYILHNFIPLPEQISYINAQIKHIQSTLSYIATVPSQLSAPSDDVQSIDFPQKKIDKEEIDQKTWQLKNDFFRPER